MSETDAIIVEKLDELISATMAGHAVWLDAGGVAVLLSQSRRHVLQYIAPRPDFPKPMRIGKPRWKRVEILEWAERMREISQPRRRRAA